MAAEGIRPETKMAVIRLASLMVCVPRGPVRLPRLDLGSMSLYCAGVVFSVRSFSMRYAIAALVIAFSISEAEAVVYCAAGVHHAGCVARPGVAVVHPGATVVAPRAAVRCAWVNGRRICR